MKIAALILTANNFLNSRSERERVMVLAMIAAIGLALDYFVFVRPLAAVCMKNAPVAEALKLELKDLNEDQKHKKMIQDRWNQAKALLTEKEKMFVAANEVPMLLENLSRSAQNSGLRIMSLVPLEITSGAAGPYARLPIRISAVAGTHEVGKFLSEVEGGSTFLKVTNLKIAANSTNERKHLVEIQIEGLRK